MASLPRLYVLSQLVWGALGLTAERASSLSNLMPSLDTAEVQIPAEVSQQRPAGSVAYDSVWARVRHGINTECKTCPHEVCTNKDWLQSSQQFRATCWVKGSQVNSSSLWLQHESGCYVSEFDTIPYFRNYTTDIKQCPQTQSKVTQQLLSIQLPTSCHICPHDKCETTREYPYYASLNITCYASTISDQCLSYCPRNNVTPDWNSILDNAPPPPPEKERLEWLKTDDNCYVNVARAGRPGRLRVQGCGPVPYLELQYRNPIALPEDPLPPLPPPLPVAPPPPACPGCDPFIWTFPQGNSAAQSTFSTYPFSPPWLTASGRRTSFLTLAPPPEASSTINPLVPAAPAFQTPKLSTSLLTTPSTPTITPSFPGLAPPAKLPSFRSTFSLGAAPNFGTFTPPAAGPASTLPPTFNPPAPFASAPPKASSSSAWSPLNLTPFVWNPPKASPSSVTPGLNLAPPFAWPPQKASSSNVQPAFNPPLPVNSAAGSFLPSGYAPFVWTPPKATSVDMRPTLSAPPPVNTAPGNGLPSGYLPYVWTAPKASSPNARPTLNAPPLAQTATGALLSPVFPPKASSSAGLLPLGVWSGFAKVATPVMTRNAPLSEQPALLPKVAALMMSRQSMVLTMSVFVTPAVCLCGAVQCPEDLELRQACTAFASQNCASQCAPRMQYYTMTVDPLSFPTPTNWTAPTFGNSTRQR